MTKNKNNRAIWNTRIKKKTSNIFLKIGSSIDIDKKLYKEDILGSIAHVEMLFKQKIISFQIKNKIIYGLRKIEKEISKNKFEFNKEYEDIHMNIEKRLFKIIGEEAGYLHTARSRNDQVITDFKLWIKTATKEIDNSLNKIIKTILKIAEKNIETIMPGFTHLKNAQVVSLGHYFMAYVEMFIRDKKRFINNMESLNENPLGVSALTGTSFNIDRNYTTKKLGFKNPTNNSIDTVSDRDFVLDYLYSCSVCSMHISKITEELIIWYSDGFGLINLNDKVLTGSSIMPHGLIANWTFDPPVSTPIFLKHAIEAFLITWYSLSVKVRAGATVIESPVCIPIGSIFSIEQIIMQLSFLSLTTSISYSFQPSKHSSTNT